MWLIPNPVSLDFNNFVAPVFHRCIRPVSHLYIDEISYNRFNNVKTWTNKVNRFMNKNKLKSKQRYHHLRYMENCPPENYLPENCPAETPPPPHEKNLSPYERSPLWKLPPEVCPRENWPLEKLPPGKIIPNEIPSPLINHTNERKSKITKFFALKKALQYNILIKITKVLFDTQMISHKILGLDTFFTEWKKNPKIERKRKSPSGMYLPVVQVK